MSQLLISGLDRDFTESLCASQWSQSREREQWQQLDA